MRRILNILERLLLLETMSNWIFLSKGGEDEYINMFAKGCNQQIISDTDFRYDTSSDPLVLRGILKHKIMKRCWKDGRTFYYIDTGYFGNERTDANPNGWKYWHRIVKNDLQHGEIISRPGDRFNQFNKKFTPWKKDGRKILVAAPDEKPCKFYSITKDDWVRQTVETIKKYTDRPVEVRERAAKRIDRIANDTLQNALDNDVFALVTYNSVAAIESIFHGIPAFTMAPSNAASPVALQDLSQINTPYYVDSDKLYAWACHLSYGQFHIDELKNGTAKRILTNEQ
jgi:hypothetical protein